MRDFLELSCVPGDESCQQVGTKHYNPVRARQECRAFINQLRRQFGPEPEGAQLSIKSNPHDFGTYLEVVCYFISAFGGVITPSTEYAFKLESEMPEHWDKEAIEELALADDYNMKPLSDR